jgi:ribosomal protein S27E
MGGSGEENIMARIMVECRDCKWRGRMPAHMISVTPCPKCGHPLRKPDASGKKERGAGFVRR